MMIWKPAQRERTGRRGVVMAVVSGILALTFAFAASEAGAQGARRFPAGSTEDRLMRAASTFLANPDFTMRQEFWKRSMSAATGKAIRTQMFKGATYRVFYGANMSQLPKGARLNLTLLDRNSQAVASSWSTAESGMTMLEFTPSKTGLYLVLMRIQTEDKYREKQVECVMMYGYE